MLVDIIEGSFPKQAGVLTTNYLGKPGLFLGVKDVHKVMRCYYVRSAVDELGIVVDDPKKPTIKIRLRDGNVVIAKVSLNDLNSIKIALALGPDDSIPMVNFLPDKKNQETAKGEGGIEAFYARQRRRRGMWAIIMGFGLLYLWMFNTTGEHATPSGSNQPAAVTQAKRKDDTFSKHVMVKTICKMAVEAQLKSPSSADFPWNMTVTGSGAVFAINSYVEAKNTFNANIKTPFYCEVTLTGSDINERSSWKITKLQL